MRRIVRRRERCERLNMIPMSSLLPKLGDSVRSHRKVLGISQEKLAERCGLDRTYISMIERGVRNPSLTSLAKLASGLDVTISNLLNGIDGP